MGGFGLEFHTPSTDKNLAPTPLTDVPQNVVDEIANKLGITAQTSKDALATALAKGKMNLPADVALKITRLSDPTGNTHCTIKKLQGGGYSLTFFQSQTVRVP